MSQTIFNAIHQALDCLWLISGRVKISLNFKFHIITFIFGELLVPKLKIFVTLALTKASHPFNFSHRISSKTESSSASEYTTILDIKKWAALAEKCRYRPQF
jgi:hypothetical protein